MDNTRLRRYIWVIVKIIILAGIVFYLSRSLFTNWERIAGYAWDIRPLPLALSFIFLILFYLGSFFLWENLCNGMGVKIPPFTNMAIWFYSQAGKYLPGKIWGPMGRIYLIERHGIRRIDTGICLAYEAAYTTLGGGIIALITIPFWTKTADSYSFNWLLLGIPAAIAGMHPKVMEWCINRALKIFKINSVSITFSVFFLLRLLFVSLLLWLLGGIGFYYLVASIVPTDGTMIITYVGIFTASCMLGILAFIAPSGLGVREGAFVLLLQPFMPSEVAVMVAFGARFWMICVEVIGIGIGGAMVSLYGKRLRGSGRVSNIGSRN